MTSEPQGPQYAERLALTPDLVQRVATAAEQFADEVEHLREPSVEKASALTLAASCWAVVDLRMARHAFRRATVEYAAAGRSYAVITGICAGAREMGEAMEAAAEQLTQAGSEVARIEVLGWMAMGEAYLSAMGAVSPTGLGSRLGQLLDRPPEHLAQPIGRLAVPLRLQASLLDSAHSMLTGPGMERWQISEQLGGVLARGDDTVDAAMTDAFHWTTLRSGILPVEPEALAMSTVAQMVALRGTREPLLLDTAVMGRHAGVVAELGQALAMNVMDEGPGRAGPEFAAT